MSRPLRIQYRAFMGEGEDLLRLLSLKKWLSILGDNQFVEQLKSRFYERKRHIEVPESQQLAPDIVQIKIEKYSTVSSAIERFKRRLASDRQLSKRLDQVRQIIKGQG